MIHSTLPIDDPSLRKLVEFYVRLLHKRLEVMHEAWANNDLTHVADLAHMIMGSAGNAGFDVLTAPVERLERSARAGRSDQTKAVLSEVQSLANRVAVPSAVSGGDGG